MVKARKYVVKNTFQGMPKRDDFDIVEEELPSLQNNEILVKAEWISVDPYLRGFNSFLKTPYDQFGYQAGEVIESRNSDYPVGTRIISHRGWRTHTIINPTIPVEDISESIYKLPDLQGLPNSLGVGAVGMPGATAYFGFLEICQPKAGETVVVTGAAGAVGSLVGQIAKVKGCKVIGFVGSDDKIQWLENELKFDKAINYKTADLAKELSAAAPNGVDCFFDNVGGELSSLIISRMNQFGRVSICGSISTYNEDMSKTIQATIVQQSVVFRQLKMEGFMANRWRDQWPQAFKDIVQWIKSGQIVAREHVYEGFDKAFDAFVGMLAGDNFGKAVVKV